MNTAESTGHPPNANLGSAPVDDLLRRLETAPLGLTERSATDRLPRGRQSDRTSRQVGLTLRLFAAQFRSPITLILIAAAILSAFLGDLADTSPPVAAQSRSRRISHWLVRRVGGFRLYHCPDRPQPAAVMDKPACGGAGRDDAGGDRRRDCLAVFPSGGTTGVHTLAGVVSRRMLGLVAAYGVSAEVVKRWFYRKMLA